MRFLFGQRLTVFSLLLGLTLSIAGCDESEEIVRRPIPPKPSSTQPEPPVSAPATTPQAPSLSALAPATPATPSASSQTTAKDHGRIIAAIVPLGNQMWFFKLMGPAGRLETHKKSFDQFVQSFKVTANQTIAWTTPSTWQERPGSGMRFATLVIDATEPKIEVPVFRLPSSSILGNIVRWRGQIGLPAITQAELEKNIQRHTIAGQEVITLDMTGTTAATNTMRPPRFRSSGQLPPNHPPLTAPAPGNTPGTAQPTQ